MKNEGRRHGNIMARLNPKTKAWIVTGVFFLAGAYAWTRMPDWRTALPFGIFYATIVFNTYFSVKLFSSITDPKNGAQIFMDAILVVLYAYLAWSMGDALHFAFAGALLFLAATAKYALLLGLTEQSKLLKKKILVDTSGTTLFVLALYGVIAGYPVQSIWALAIVFVVANVILFSVWPLYRLHP